MNVSATPTERAPPTSLPIAIRDATPDDVNFIKQSWIRSFQTSPDVNKMASQVYFAAWATVVSGILARSNVRVVTLPSAPVLICAWLCWEPGETTRLHYVYTKHNYRKSGFAKALLAELPSGPLIYTHRNQMAGGWMSRHRALGWNFKAVGTAR